MFDAFVASILNYGCEVWGLTKSKEIERIHLKYCKYILGVKIRTSNMGIYGELGRYPLYINRFVRVVKYWLKLSSTQNIILKIVYNNLLYQCENGKHNWLFKIKSLLSSHEFLYIRNDPHCLDHNAVLLLFKQRLIDDFMQNWRADLNNNRVLVLYKEVKPEFGYANYLDIFCTKRLRNAFARLRLSSHTLRIETGRYSRIRLERHERVCQLCDTSDIEDEYHFILICPTFSNIRQKFIPNYYIRHPSMFKFICLLQSINKKELINFSKYLHEAFTIRLNILNNVVQ